MLQRNLSKPKNKLRSTQSLFDAIWPKLTCSGHDSRGETSIPLPLLSGTGIESQLLTFCHKLTKKNGNMQINLIRSLTMSCFSDTINLAI